MRETWENEAGLFPFLSVRFCPPLYPFLGCGDEDSPAIPNPLPLFDLREQLKDDRIWQGIGDDRKHPLAVGVLSPPLNLLDQIPDLPPLLPRPERPS